jgi:uncharacterized protein (DUF736 family)
MPTTWKRPDTHPDSRTLTQGIEVGAGWTRTGGTAGKEYASLSVAAPKFGPKKLYADLGEMAGWDDENLHAVIWTPGA